MFVCKTSAGNLPTTYKLLHLVLNFAVWRSCKAIQNL